MALGKYKVPKELRDEDKWFRFFTKRQLAFMMAALAISAVVCSLFSKLNLLIIGVIISITLIIVTIITTFVKMPRKRYLYGGGIGVDVILRRIIHRRKKSNRIIYSKCVNFDTRTGKDGKLL